MAFIQRRRFYRLQSAQSERMLTLTLTKSLCNKYCTKYYDNVIYTLYLRCSIKVNI
jgi:hypothetical protein